MAGSPSLRRDALDRLAGQRSPAYAARPVDLRPGAPAAQRPAAAIREEQAVRDELRFWDATLLEAGAAVVAERHRLLERAGRAARARPTRRSRRTRPRRTRSACATRRTRRSSPARRSATRSRGASPRRPRRRSGTGPRWSARTATTWCSSSAAAIWPAFASRGQQRTAILAFKLAELDLLTALDGRPPLLLLDDVFTSSTRNGASHLVRRIAELPQAFVTTTTLDDLDPALRSIGDSVGGDPGPTGRARLDASRRRPTAGPSRARRADEPDARRPSRPARSDRRPPAGRGARAGARGRAAPRPGDRDLGRDRRRARPPAAGACRARAPRADAIVVAARGADRRRGAPDAGVGAARRLCGGARRTPSPLPAARLGPPRTARIAQTGPPRIIPVRSASRGRHALPSGVVAHSMRLAAWPFVSS